MTRLYEWVATLMPLLTAGRQNCALEPAMSAYVYNVAQPDLYGTLWSLISICFLIGLAHVHITYVTLG
jgi:hypothetical protein